MAQAANMCNHAGCYCKAYVVPTSKWSKGKCKQCLHSKKEHGELVAEITFDSDKVADAPIQSNQYSSQIDGKMGIVPSGKTNYKDVGGGGSQQKQTKSIYSIVLDEKDWINWSSDDLLVWLQQKKKFPQEINLNEIQHEFQKNNIKGTKVTQLSHSTMLSYGFTDYQHRSKLLEQIIALIQANPAATQKPKYNAQQNNNNNNANKKKQNEEQKEAVSKDEESLMKEANLNESQWKTWSTDQVWKWIKIKQGWSNTEEMEYLFVHKLNEYEEKLKSQDINLNGSKFSEVQQDIKTQKLLKGIGFPFSARKAVYKHIDNLLKQYPN